MKKERQNEVVTFVKSDDGAGAIEYAMLAALLAISAIAGLQALSSGIQDMYQTVEDAMTGS